MNEDHGYERDAFGPPQRVKLPFRCDVKILIEHEVQAFPSWKMPQEGMGVDHQQYYMVLTMELESVEKPRQVTQRKAMRIFKSP